MMKLLLAGLVVMVIGAALFRIWYRSWRRRRVVANRRVEAPNSAYSSAGVRSQEDRERWGDIKLGRLHPLNQEEVVRLLDVVDGDGVRSLSPRDRLFLDNMTLPRMGA